MHSNCPICGNALIRFEVLSGGKREYCQTCGFLRKTAQPEKTGAVEINDRSALLCYAQAVLQTIHQIRVCRRCQTQIAILRRSIGVLEQERKVYIRAPHRTDGQQIDTFLDELIEQLQPGMARLCSMCRKRMERLTWELLVSFLLEYKRQDES